MASASQSGDPPALVAFRELAAVLADPSLSASVDGFELQIRLRARADALVTGATSPSAAAEIRLSTIAFLELVTLGLPEPALRCARERSARYLSYASGGTERIAAHGGPLVATLLQGVVADNTAGGERCVLTHGCSASVTAILLRAAQSAHFTLIVAEGSAGGGGHATAAALLEAGVPVRMIEPCAVARVMASVALVLCGAHAVLQDGGVVGDIGTLTIAHVAAAHNRPFCVAAPHYLLTREPPDAALLLEGGDGDEGGGGAPPAGERNDATLAAIRRRRRDETPPRLIKLILTDAGVMPPAAVADELLQRERLAGAPRA